MKNTNNRLLNIPSNNQDAKSDYAPRIRFGGYPTYNESYCCGALISLNILNSIGLATKSCNLDRKSTESLL